MRVVVVGAGIAGLVAARELALEHDVVVFDKGRSVGGRLATRRIGDAVLDHGAQFFTVRGEAFRAQTDDWLDRGVVRLWCHGFHGREDGYPRYVGASGMTALAKDLATGLDCRCSSLVFTMRFDHDRWSVITDDGCVEPADAVVVTCPTQQTWALLAESPVELPDGVTAGEYERTVSLLAVLDRPSSVQAPGGVQFDPHDEAEPFAFVADHQARGVSRVPAITCHATVPWSLAHWDEPTEHLRRALLERARPWIGDAAVVEAQVKKWRFATPTAIWPAPCWSDTQHRVIVAGDAFAGPTVEGAYVSGLAAAATVRSFI